MRAGRAAAELGILMAASAAAIWSSSRRGRVPLRRRLAPVTERSTPPAAALKATVAGVALGNNRTSAATAASRLAATADGTCRDRAASAMRPHGGQHRDGYPDGLKSVARHIINLRLSFS